jgi:hypothetical protein
VVGERMREKVLLAGPCLGELWWDFERFAPYVLWKKKQLEKEQGNVMLVCLERRDRFDIWGMNCDVLVPLEIQGDGTTYKQDCFGLSNFPRAKYNMILEKFRNHYSSYEILDHLYPKIDNNQFLNKDQFPKDRKVYDFNPRSSNKKLLDNYLKTDKPIVTIASRFRPSFPRNWFYWSKFYELIWNSKALENYCFVVCGKSPDYVQDKLDRFYDVNKIKLDSSSSLIGITIELLKRSILTVGSQSSIPNISLLLGTPAFEWGDQKKLHTVDYNIRNTPVTFIEDMKYKLDARTVFFEMIKILEEWEKKNGKD